MKKEDYELLKKVLKKNNNAPENNKNYVGYAIVSAVASLLIGALIPFIAGLLAFLIGYTINNKDMKGRGTDSMLGAGIGFLINILIFSLLTI